MEPRQKLLGALGLCKKAGKLIVGFDAVSGAIESGQVKLLATSKDLSPKSAKEIIRICQKHGVEHVPVGIAMEDIKRIVGKKAGILAVTDEGLAKSVAAKAAACQIEEDCV